MSMRRQGGEQAELLRTALSQCEGYCTLTMWREAADVLDGLPYALRSYLRVYEQRLEINIGVRDWLHALILAESLVSLFPGKARLWFRLACIQAQSGDADAARASAKECRRLDPTMRSRLLDEPMLAGI